MLGTYSRSHTWTRVTLGFEYTYKLELAGVWFSWGREVIDLS